MVNKKVKKEIKKKAVKANRNIKKGIENIFEGKEEQKQEQKQEQEQENKISFNFSMKMDKDGLTGNVSAEGLGEDQKEVFESMIRDGLHNMNHINRVRQVYSKQHPLFDRLFDMPIRVRRNRFNPIDDFFF